MSESSATSDINIEVNQSFDISLYSEAGSTGYLWCLSGLKTGVLLLGETHSQVPPVMPGSRTRQTFTFVATKEMSGKISFALIRPWNPDVAADTRTFTFQANVTKSSTLADDLSRTAGGGSFVKNDSFRSHHPPMALYAAPQPISDYCGTADSSTSCVMPAYGYPPVSRTANGARHIVVAYGFPSNPTGAHAFVESTGSNCMVKYGFPHGVSTDPDGCTLKYGFPTQGPGGVIPLYGYPPLDANTCATTVEEDKNNCIVKYGIPTGIATDSSGCTVKYGFPTMKYGFPVSEGSKS